MKQLWPEENWHGICLPHRERILPQCSKEAGYGTDLFADATCDYIKQGLREKTLVMFISDMGAILRPRTASTRPPTSPSAMVRRRCA